MKKVCELCSKPASMYCDSDEARLCWDCDEKVHSANFLVAKHSRSLLCHVCKSPTPWKASGTKLGPTISVCEGCFENCNYAQNPTSSSRMRIRRPHHHPHEEEEEEEEEDDETESVDREHVGGDSESGSTDEEYSDDEDIDEEEDGENQVVPWASCPTTPSASSTSPLNTSSVSEHGSFSARDGGATVSSSLKRSRDSRIQDSDDEDDVCCSSQLNSSRAGMENTNASSFRTVKMARAEREPDSSRRRMELVASLMSFQERTDGARGEHNASEVIRRISNLSRDAL